MTSDEFATVGIAHNMKKMTSVMYAERAKDVRKGQRMSGTGEGWPERAKDVASEGRATRGTEGGH